MKTLKEIEPKNKGVGGYQRPYQGRTDEWLTPKYIIDELTKPPWGSFDLDPCSPIDRPWDTAKMHYNIKDDGLSADWDKNQRIWCNPPYGPQTHEWLKKLSKHGNGIALVFARIETKMFFNYVWGKADAVFVFKGRLNFCTPDGLSSGNNAGGASVLIAYGSSNADCLRAVSLEGYCISF